MFCIYLRKNSDCATYSINWLVFITEMKSVYSAVRTGSLNTAVCAWALKVYFSLQTVVRTQSFEVFHSVVKTMSFGIWLSADWQLPTDVSETLAAFIIRVAQTALGSPICPEDGDYGFIREVRKLVQVTESAISKQIITDLKRLQCRSCDYPNEWGNGHKCAGYYRRRYVLFYTVTPTKDSNVKVKIRCSPVCMKHALFRCVAFGG